MMKMRYISMKKGYFHEKRHETVAAGHMNFIEYRKDIGRSSTLYSFKAPFELLHADIADIRFLVKSAVNPKCCLLFTDLFTSKFTPHEK